MLKRKRNLPVTFLLSLGLIGLLIAYYVVVNDLPSRIYTIAQQEYLDYNYQRSIAQSAPTWNYVQPGGQIATALLPGQESHVRAILSARYEEQEGVSVAVYDLDFRGEYRLIHPGPMPITVELIFPFPHNLENLHEVRFVVDGEEPPEAQFSTRGIAWQTVLQGGAKHRIVVTYKADGANSFSYGLHHGQRSDVDVTFTVEDLLGSQASDTSLPLTAHEVNGDSETFTWNYEGLIAERDVQIDLPVHLSFTQRVAQLQDDFRTLARLAPLLVALFLAALAGVLHLDGVRLRPEGYLLAGCAAALFYPLLTFLSGVVAVSVAAALALLLVSGLLLAFLTLMTNRRRLGWRVGLLLVVFLGLFSLGVLTPWRGLSLTGGGLMLVGNFMLLYARRPAVSEPEPDPPQAEIAPEPAPTMLPFETTLDPIGLYCAHCASPLADGYSFCPGCGYDISRFRHCADCGHQQYVPEGGTKTYCIGCGQALS